jgi:hypothetical protein
MTMQARLQKVTQGLSPLQRMMLILRAEREGREPDPELSRIADSQQNKAFNRYVALVYVINHELGALCYTASGFSQFLEHYAAQVRLLEEAADELEKAHGLEPVRKPRDWRTAGEMQVNEFLRSLARELKRDLGDVLAQRWSEIGALEQVWDELAGEFGGEDPVRPDLRSQAAETRERLLELARECGARKRLGPPAEAQLAEAHRVVDHAFEQLEPLL